MPRKRPLLSTTVVNDVVEVNSRAYGKHYRKPRGTKTPISINSAFQKSVELNKVANPVAKAVKDAIDPFFRRNFKDGTLWSRLVGLFKKHLAQKSEVDFRILEDFELFKHPRMGRNFEFEVDVTLLNEPDPSIRIELSSTASSKLDKHEAKTYRQTLIVVFLDGDFKATTFSNEIMLPLQKITVYDEELKEDFQRHATQRQIVQPPMPMGTKWALVVVTCEALRKGEKSAPTKLCRIKVVKAYEVK